MQHTPPADGLQKLTEMPLSWFLQLLVTARDKAVRPAVLASLAQMYIDKAMEKISKVGSTYINYFNGLHFLYVHCSSLGLLAIFNGGPNILGEKIIFYILTEQRNR